MTVNYRDCVHGTTGGTISPDPVPRPGSIGFSLSGKGTVPGSEMFQLMQRRPGESGYPLAAGMVTSPSEFWDSFDVIRLWTKERIKARHFGNLLEAAETESLASEDSVV